VIRFFNKVVKLQNFKSVYCWHLGVSNMAAIVNCNGM